MSQEVQKKSRLNRFLGVAGGITLEDANVRADMHLHLMQDRVETEIREALRKLGECLASESPPDKSARTEMKSLTVMITGLGGTFGREALSKAGYSFCRLLHELGDHWDNEAAQLHWNAMGLLFDPRALPATEQDELLAGLNKVRERTVARRAGA